MEKNALMQADVDKKNKLNEYKDNLSKVTQENEDL